MKCRSCNLVSDETVIHLGSMPPANNFITKDNLHQGNLYFPLTLWFCESCNLLQTVDFLKPEQLFTEEYTYLSSVSKSWLVHSQKFVNEIIVDLKLGSHSYVVEIASNDGYLLQEFQRKEIQCLGIEPTLNTAAMAVNKGINTITKFFTKSLAIELSSEYPDSKPDLIIGNNVLAHVPDLNDFVEGVSILLKENGTAVFEFPHLLELIKQNAFDTIYHEHFSYLSVVALDPLFLKWNLQIYKVQELPTHGGSLRIFVKQKKNNQLKIHPSVKNVMNLEDAFGLHKKFTYEKFNQCVLEIKINVLNFLHEKKKSGKKIVGFGAAAKGITFINFIGLNSSLIEKIADNAETKVGKFAPGCLIPIVSFDEVKKANADYIVVFPWNLVDELIPKLKKELPNTKIITFLPFLKIW